ncbi:MAG: hypothetical protein M1817_000972 [Caeruleum heppii]|nr:MAG: hypothetical protein M1817_000972 [Caeruleum heppii]
MTEPEDLEEDLFADLYEADENPPKPSQPAPVPPPITSAPIHEYVAANGPKQEDQASANQFEPKPDERKSSNEDQNMSGVDAANGDQAHTWDNQNNNFTGPAEPEYHPTGIKEDGSLLQHGMLQYAAVACGAYGIEYRESIARPRKMWREDRVAVRKGWTGWVPSERCPRATGMTYGQPGRELLEHPLRDSRKYFRECGPGEGMRIRRYRYITSAERQA